MRSFARIADKEGDMLLLACYDDNPKHTLVEKIDAACVAYALRFGQRPNLALISEDADPPTIPGVRVQGLRRIGRNVVHVGVEA
jgi:hypothetical protein